MDNKVSNQENEKKEVSISGRLGADAKLGESKNEKKPVLTFSIADNADKENVKWHNVQMWDKNIPKQDLKQGDQVELKGYFKTFQTAQGEKEEFVATKLSSHTLKQDASDKITHSIKGNLGQDPEFKDVNGKKVAAFSVGFKDENDANKTNWQNIQVWNENIEKNKVAEMKKGDFVELKGYYGKEYQTKNNETKKDFILEESKILKHAQKQGEAQTEKQSETKDEKKSNGIKM